MESLLAQIESWVIGLIDKRMAEVPRLITDFEKIADDIFKQRIANESLEMTIKMEEDIKTIVNKMNTTPNTFENEIFKKMINDTFDMRIADGPMPFNFEKDVQNIIDNNAPNFEEEVETIVDNIIEEKIIDNFDISNYEHEIGEAIDNKLEDVEFNITASIH